MQGGTHSVLSMVGALSSIIHIHIHKNKNKNTRKTHKSTLQLSMGKLAVRPSRSARYSRRPNRPCPPQQRPNRATQSKQTTTTRESLLAKQTRKRQGNTQDRLPFRRKQKCNKQTSHNGSEPGQNYGIDVLVANFIGCTW